MTVSNIFSKATGPIVTKFHVEPPWAGETKICSNHSSRLACMATMPIYGNNL